MSREVWIRWDSHLVRIFNDRMKQIALYPRKEPGGFGTPQIIHLKKTSTVENGVAWLLHTVTTPLRITRVRLRPGR